MVELAAGDIGIDKPTPGAPATRGRRIGESAGFSYIEVLVAIVLVGVTVIATIVALRATVVAGRIGDERSHLLLWVQEGTEALHRMPYVSCGTAGTLTDPEVDTIRASYQTTLDGVTPPNGLTGALLTVSKVEFMSVDPVTYTEMWDAKACEPEFEVALLQVSATSADGTSITAEVMVDD